MAYCYRHPDRETGVSCSNCGRPICPDCMTPTPVGMRCPECAKQRTQVRTIRDEATAWHRAPVTVTIVAINVAVYLLGLVFSGGHGAITAGGFNSLQEHGALYGPLVANGDWWRIVTSGFLHVGLLHVGLNVVLIYLLGVQLETALGHTRFGALYMVALIGGSLGSMLLSPHAVVVGASGAGFGLMGAFAVVAYSRGIDLVQSGIGALIVINILFTFSVPHIAIGGHLGGLAIGALCGYIFEDLDVRRHAFGRSPAVAMLIVLAIGVACFAGTIAAAHAGAGI